MSSTLPFPTTERDAVPARALDLITETLISCPDPCRRSRIVGNLVREMLAIVVWLDPDGAAVESASLAVVAQEAVEHERRMHDLRDAGALPLAGSAA